MEKIQESLRKNTLVRSLNKVTPYQWVIFVCCLVGLFGVFITFFRITSPDETLYLRETMIITESIKQLKWWGDLATGVHGFIFKLPVALLFLVTGPSVKAATLFGVSVAIASIILLYKTLLLYLKREDLALYGVLLMAASYQFIIAYPTYLREIPVLFSFLLFLYLFLRNKPSWVLGLSLLFIFDSKEYVFYMIAPAIGLWIIITAWKQSKGNILRFIKTSLLQSVLMFGPSLVWLLLMFYTSVIPINMFNASILGLVTDKTWSVSQFDPAAATANLLENGAKEIPSIIGTGAFVETLNNLLSYVGKILYPSTFTYLSIPLFIVVPAIIVSLRLLVTNLRDRLNRVDLLFALMLLSYVAVYILRASHGRYLFPISPLIYLFFLRWLFSLAGFSKRGNGAIFLFTTILILLGLTLETKSVALKFGFNAAVIGALYYHLLRERITFGLKAAYRPLLVIFVAILTTGGVALLSLYVRQIKPALQFGAEREIEKVLSHADEEEKVWINDIGWSQLPSFYRKDTFYNAEWNWFIVDFLPKGDLLEVLGDANTYTLDSIGSPMDESMLSSAPMVRSSESSGFPEVEAKTINGFKNYITRHGVEKVFILRSEDESIVFPMQNQIEKLVKEDWLELSDEVSLKGKTLFMFTVKD